MPAASMATLRIPAGFSKLSGDKKKSVKANLNACFAKKKFCAIIVSGSIGKNTKNFSIVPNFIVGGGVALKKWKNLVTSSCDQPSAKKIFGRCSKK